MIVPALLTDKRSELSGMLDTCAKFTDYVQIDIMDGSFVPSNSLGIEDLKGLKSQVRSEAHLMVSDPLAWLDVFKEIGSERIIYHFEADADHSKVISEIKGKGFGVGIGINPGTKIDDFKILLDDVDSVLFLSVNPGFYGSDFIPEVLEKVKQFKDEFGAVWTGIDGGIKLSNIERVKATGVDYICVGSAILKNIDPKSAYQEFVTIADG